MMPWSLLVGEMLNTRCILVVGVGVLPLEFSVLRIPTIINEDHSLIYYKYKMGYEQRAGQYLE